MRFSIIVPVYNVEEYLGRCVDSLRAQDYPADQMELILVDDGSRDHSGEMCDVFAKEDPRIRVIHKENGGLSSARNAGLDQASGDYVIFADSDDYLEPTACQVLEQVIRQYQSPDAVVYDGWEERGNQASHIWRIPGTERACKTGPEYIRDRYRQTNMNVEAWLYCYKRSFLEEGKLRFREGILHEDVEFTPRVLLKAKSVAETPKQLYHYVIRENSISTKKDKTKNIQDLFCTLQELDNLARQQEADVCKWMENGILNSYLNMIYDAKMYQKKYKNFLRKDFLKGKAATKYNRFRAALCGLNVRLYCLANDLYKIYRNRKSRV